jgi:hypothetical protein
VAIVQDQPCFPKRAQDSLEPVEKDNQLAENTTHKKHGRPNFIYTLAGASTLAGIKSPFSYAQAAGKERISITDMYITQVRRQGSIVVRLETNKGIIGKGKCRDLDSGA